MAGPLDSLRAGMGDPEARERFRQEQAVRQAQAQMDAAQEEARQQALRERAAPTIQQARESIGSVPIIGPMITGEARPADIVRAQLAAENEAAIRAIQPQPSGPSGFDVAGTAAEVGGSYKADAEARAARLGASSIVRRNNPMHEPTQQYVGEVRSAKDQDRAGFEAAQAAELNASRTYAQHFGEEYGRISAQADAADAAQEVRAQKITEQEHALRTAQESQQRAVDALSAVPEDDPTGGWADVPAWKKALFAISAAMMYIGGLDPFTHINSAIQRNIEALRHNRAAKRSVVEARGETVSQQQTLLDKVLLNVQDGRAADLILENAHWKQAEAKMQAMAAKLGVDMMQPQQQQLFAQMRERQAKNELELAGIAARNPKAFVSRQLDVRGPQRAVEMKLLDYELERAGKGEDASYEFAKEALKNGGGGAADIGPHGLPELSEGEARFMAEERQRRGETFRQKQEMSGGLAGQRLQSARGLIQDWLKEFSEDIPGQSEFTLPGILGGRGTTGFTRSIWADSDRLKMDMDLRNLISEALTTNITGAVASPLQVKKINDILLDESLSGNQVRSGMTAALRMLDLQQQAAERTLSDEAAAEYRGVSPKELPKMDPLMGGRTQVNTSVEQQAARLGGRLK